MPVTPMEVPAARGELPPVVMSRPTAELGVPGPHGSVVKSRSTHSDDDAALPVLASRRRGEEPSPCQSRVPNVFDDGGCGCCCCCCGRAVAANNHSGPVWTPAVERKELFAGSVSTAKATERPPAREAWLLPLPVGLGIACELSGSRRPPPAEGGVRAPARESARSSSSMAEGARCDASEKRPCMRRSGSPN